MTNLFDNYKSATQKMLNLTPLPRKGHIRQNDLLVSLLYNPTRAHPKYSNHTLTKQNYTMIVRDEFFDEELKTYESTPSILIVANVPNSAFTKKYQNFGEFKFSYADRSTNTIVLEKI